MTDLDLKGDVVFVGEGATPVAWYRMYLPAFTLGIDHVGLVGDPPGLRYVTGLTRKGGSVAPDLRDYKIVVLQLVSGKAWLEAIRMLQSLGVTVVYEVDDWLQAIAKAKDHGYRKGWDAEALADHEMCMRAADAMIVSTDFLAKVYRTFNQNIYVCRNGVDMRRYDLQKPVRVNGEVNIGWAGATGHRDALRPWLEVVGVIMKAHAHVNFVSIGVDYASAFHGAFPRERSLGVPFAALEQYPAAMTMFDIALAPAANTGFYRGKSDLRWLEASALATPVVGHPMVYPDIEHGVTGFKASSQGELASILGSLVTDERLRLTVGQQAKAYVQRERSIEVTAKQWVGVFQALWAQRMQ